MYVCVYTIILHNPIMINAFIYLKIKPSTLDPKPYIKMANKVYGFRVYIKNIEFRV